MKKSIIAASVALLVSAPALAGGAYDIYEGDNGLPSIPANSEVVANDAIRAGMNVHADSSCSFENGYYDIKGINGSMNIAEFKEWGAAHGGKNFEVEKRWLAGGQIASYEFDNFSIGGQKVEQVNMVIDVDRADAYANGDVEFRCYNQVHFFFEDNVGDDMRRALEKKFKQPYDVRSKGWSRVAMPFSHRASLKGDQLSIEYAGSYKARVVQSVDMNDF